MKSSFQRKQPADPRSELQLGKSTRFHSRAIPHDPMQTKHIYEPTLPGAMLTATGADPLQLQQCISYTPPALEQTQQVLQQHTCSQQVQGDNQQGQLFQLLYEQVSQQAELVNVEEDTAAACTVIRPEVERLNRDTSSSPLASAQDPAAAGTGAAGQAALMASLHGPAASQGVQFAAQLLAACMIIHGQAIMFQSAHVNCRFETYAHMWVLMLLSSSFDC